MDKITVTLSWPDRRLNPNARIHHMAKAGVKKAAFDAAHWDTVQQVPSQLRQGLEQTDGPIMLALTFRPPDKRRRDLDNMLASCKAALDGLASGLRVDDYRFELTLRRGEPVKLGRVEVTL